MKIDESMEFIGGHMHFILYATLKSNKKPGFGKRSNKKPGFGKRISNTKATPPGLNISETEIKKAI